MAESSARRNGLGLALPEKPAQSPSFEFGSPAFEPSTKIPKRHAADGDGVSPPLSWKNAPAGTAALAITMEDLDAPGGRRVHWVLYDVAPEDGALAEGLPGYRGPLPPDGKVHHYVFRAYALSAPTGLPPGAGKSELMDAMREKVLGQAVFVGLYGR